jgi:hypothetical protein
MGADRKAVVSTTIRVLSIVCSLAFWIELLLMFAVGELPAWFPIGLAGWALDLLLACIATILRPKRWWVALLVPVLSFVIAFFFVFSNPNWKGTTTESGRAATNTVSDSGQESVATIVGDRNDHLHVSQSTSNL